MYNCGKWSTNIKDNIVIEYSNADAQDSTWIPLQTIEYEGISNRIDLSIEIPLHALLNDPKRLQIRFFQSESHSANMAWSINSLMLVPSPLCGSNNIFDADNSVQYLTDGGHPGAISASTKVCTQNVVSYGMLWVLTSHNYYFLLKTVYVDYKRPPQ